MTVEWGLELASASQVPHRVWGCLFVTTAPVRSFRGLCEYTLEKAKRGLEGKLTGCVLFRVMTHSEFPDSTAPVCKQMMVGHVVTSIERATAVALQSLVPQCPGSEAAEHSLSR